MGRPLAATRLLALALATGCAADPRPGAGDVGGPPRGFTVALTGGGPPPQWVVRTDPTRRDDPTVIVQESADQTSYRFPLCVYDGVTAADVSVSAEFKTIAGSVDQAAGLVLRYTPENYYVARANALEGNVNLFKTVAGKRVKIDEVDVPVTGGRWHSLRFVARGRHLTVTFDGKVVIDRDDDTFATAGKTGLWTKADSVTAFTEFEAEPLP